MTVYNKFSPAEKVFIATPGCILLGVVIEIRTVQTVAGSETRYKVEHFDTVCGTAAMIVEEHQLFDAFGYGSAMTAWREGLGKQADEHAEKIIADLTAKQPA
jgi:hypothetical protein